MSNKIVITAEFLATLSGMDQVVSEMQKGIKEGTAKMDLGKGIGKEFNKKITDFKSEYQDFLRMTKDGFDFGDSKKVLADGEKVLKLVEELQTKFSVLRDGLTLSEAKKLFPDSFSTNIEGIDSKLNAISAALAKVEQAEAQLNAAKLEFKVDGFEQIKSEAEAAKVNLEGLKVKFEEVKSKIAEKIQLKIDTKQANLDAEAAAFKNSKRGLNARDRAFASEESAIRKAMKNTQVTRDANGLLRYGDYNIATVKGAKGEDANAAREQFQIYIEQNKRLGQIIAERRRLKEELAKEFDGSKRQKEIEALTKQKQEVLEAKDEKTLKAKGGSAIDQESLSSLKEYTQATEKAAESTRKLEEAQKKTAKVKPFEEAARKSKVALNELVDKTDLSKMFDVLNKGSVSWFDNFNKEMLKTGEGFDKIKNELTKVDEVDFKTVTSELTNLSEAGGKVAQGVSEGRNQLKGIGDAASSVRQATNEMDQLKSRVLYFFSLTNSFRLVKQAIKSSLDTVKDLDKAMEGIAVVSRFSVEDMWAKLPQFTKNARELGVSIKDSYAATTLYVQTGLDLNNSMGVAQQTLKMARIGGLETSQATDAMVSALRGFNLAINEVNATRVSDVYSNLAAKTASTTGEIATAMEKTASIAANAKMTLENVSALLAAGIEATRESPETIGTALKTVIARFSEVKNLYSENELMGTDEEGQEINVNKIQEALRTANIDMTDYFLGKEGLDSVLFKLSERWDDLTEVQKKYIATQAAGSRLNANRLHLAA